MSDEIKPCPFCGFGGVVIGLDPISGQWDVSCPGCGARGPISDDPVTDWNHRSED